MKRLSTLALTVATASMSLALSGCETGDDRTLAQGQTCLDAATTAAQANSCVTIVQGLTSPESYLIRCSANFVAQGFTGTRIADSINKIKNNSSTAGSDAMAGMLAYLVLPNATPTATDIINNCTAANSRSMLRLATAASLATTITGVGGVSPTSGTAQADMAALIAAATGTTPAALAKQADLGATATVALGVYCQTGSSYESTEVCTDLKAAVNAGGGNQAIGAALLAQLQH